MTSAARRPIVRPSTVLRVAVKQIALEELAHDEGDTAGVEHVGGGVPTAGRMSAISGVRSAVAPELVDAERDAELGGDGQGGGGRRSWSRRWRPLKRWHCRSTPG